MFIAILGIKNKTPTKIVKFLCYQPKLGFGGKLKVQLTKT
jgi:hypothetical protein